MCTFRISTVFYLKIHFRTLRQTSSKFDYFVHASFKSVLYQQLFRPFTFKSKFHIIRIRTVFLDMDWIRNLIGYICRLSVFVKGSNNYVRYTLPYKCTCFAHCIVPQVVGAVHEYYDFLIKLFTPFHTEFNGMLQRYSLVYDFKLKDTQCLAKHFIRLRKRLQMVSPNIVMQRWWRTTVEKRKNSERICVSYLYSTCLQSNL